MIIPPRRHPDWFSYLETLYKLVNGSPQHLASHYHVVLKAGLTPRRGLAAWEYLCSRCLVKQGYLENSLRITPAGVKEYINAIKTRETQVAEEAASFHPGTAPDS
jgi:hypothetical protein